MGTWGFIVVFSPLLYMFEMSHNIVLKESKKDDADKLKCQRIEKELPGKYEPPPQKSPQNNKPVPPLHGWALTNIIFPSSVLFFFF